MTSACLVAALALSACGGTERSQQREKTTLPIQVEKVHERSRSIWISPAELRRRPTSGPEWDQLVADAGKDPGKADIANQDSDHDVYTLAEGLMCARTNDPAMCAKARDEVVSAIGTEDGARWLAVGRNLTAYVIAADLLGLRADGDPGSAGSRVEEWIRGFVTKRLADNNTGKPITFRPFASGSNASAQQGAAYAAMAAYLRDPRALQRAWDAFRRYVCDPGAPDREHIDLHRGVKDGWAADDRRPCAVAPLGAEKQVPADHPGAGSVHRLDGALINDMARGGTYRWPPSPTRYPWVGLEGFVPAAVILYRAGYPAFEAGHRAVLRAANYLYYVSRASGDDQWFRPGLADEIVQLINVAYGTHFPLRRPVGPGRTVGWTDWSHARIAPG